MSALVVTRDGPVATLLLNRPEKHNALTYAMWCGIADVCGELADDPSVRVLVVRGAGAHFCAGADIAELGVAPDYGERVAAAETALYEFPKPTIAFVQGSCVGGGCGLAIDCDLRLADTSARFGITPARLGIVYPPRSLERTVRLLGGSAAKLLLYSAELVDAGTALRVGLVDELHEPVAAAERLEELTRVLAARSLLTQQATKEMVRAVLERGGVDDELVRRWQREVAASTDGAEGRAAFAERREPRFTWPG